MTHKIAHIFAALFCAFLLMGCQEKIQTSSWAEEPIPIEIKISVSDTEGNNMLDPTKVSNISSNVITASFLGNSYLRDSAPKNGISLWTVNSEDNKPHVLVFGQISGGKSLENEPLVIDVFRAHLRFQPQRSDAVQFRLGFDQTARARVVLGPRLRFGIRIVAVRRGIEREIALRRTFLLASVSIPTA